MTRPSPLAVVAVAVCALCAVSGAAPRAAQEHEHGHVDAPESGGRITPTAKKLNDDFAADAARAVSWFETAGRALFDRRVEVVDMLGLKAGMDVADIGAGTGLFSRLIAQRVGPDGTVYAIEIAPSLVAHIGETARAADLANIKPILGDPKSPRLDAQSVDLVFIADTYHHFEHPTEMLRGIRTALRPNGLVVLIDFERIEGVSHPFVLEMVRAGKGTFFDEFRNAGFELFEEVPMLAAEGQYVFKFTHRSTPP